MLKLAANWDARTETLSVSGDGGVLVMSADYTLDPASGNAVTITFPATTIQHLTLTFTANTGWPAVQISALEAYAHQGLRTEAPAYA